MTQAAGRWLAALLATALLATAAWAGPPGRDVRARERPSETVERREREARTERSVEHLPAEFRRSWLYQHEIGRPEAPAEGGHTLRRHVPERNSDVAIRRVLEPRELQYEQNRSINRPDLSVYKDLPHAERAIEATLRDPANAEKIQQWRRDRAVTEPLALEGRHADPVGLVYERSRPDRPIDLNQVPKEVNTNIVVLKKTADGYTILTSYPKPLP